MQKAIVSVIVPIFNIEAYVSQCLESLRNQTFKNIEIICMDDGSSDSSGRIADEFSSQDDRFKVYHKTNTGYGNTMNQGIRYASADYIAVLEGDDFAEPDMIEKLYYAAVESQADIVKCNFNEYTDKSSVFADILGNYPKRTIFSPDEYPGIMNVRHCVWTGMYRKSFLYDHDIWFHETPGASYQDVGFLLKCWYNVDKIYLIEDALVNYRLDNPNSSVKSTKKVFCVCEEYKSLMKYITSHPNCADRAQKSLVTTLYKDYCGTFMRIDPLYQYAFVLRWKEDLLRLKSAGYYSEEMLDEENTGKVHMLLADVDCFYYRQTQYYSEVVNRKQIYENCPEIFHSLMRNDYDFAIFGAGRTGRKVWNYMKARGYADKIKRFLVSSLDGNVKEIDGIAVCEIGQIRKYAGQYCVLIAVKEEDQDSVRSLLKSNGFKSVYNLTFNIRQRIGMVK